LLDASIRFPCCYELGTHLNCTTRRLRSSAAHLNLPESEHSDESLVNGLCRLNSTKPLFAPMFLSIYAITPPADV
jgi:hypothetical protein